MSYKTKEELLNPNLQISRLWMGVDGCYIPVTATMPAVLGNTHGAITSVVGTGSLGIIDAPGVDKSIYLSSILVTNSNASIGTRVDIRSGTDVLWTGYAAPEGGWSHSFPVAIRVGNNVGLNAICATASAGIYISASGFTGEF